jgi:Uma2 family endonuclease
MPTMPITQATYETILLEDPEGRWELIRGQLKEKPTMSTPHNRTIARLMHQLGRQLDVDEYEVRASTGRLRYRDESYFIPDVHVVPVALLGDAIGPGQPLEVLDAPMPFVAEVWSPSTGLYDVDLKLPEYQRRGDHEIWRIHPLERSVRIWRRAPDGSYAVQAATGGKVTLHALPSVTVDLDAMFVGVRG